MEIIRPMSGMTFEQKQFWVYTCNKTFKKSEKLEFGQNDTYSYISLLQFDKLFVKSKYLTDIFFNV